MRITMDPVAGNEDLPSRSDVIVIGGGIIGVSTALFLAERGVSVTLCEKGIIGAEQSGRNWGWCRTMGRDAAEIPLTVESLRLWRRMNEITGLETGFRERGTLYLLDGEKALASYESWMEHARDHALSARFIEGAEITNLLPGLAKPWKRGLYTPTDGTAEPFKATPAMARAAQKKGAVILQHCAVRGIETEGGAISGVVTERGAIRCGAVVLAGGAWSRLFAGNMGLNFPTLPVINTVMRTAPDESLPDLAVGGPDFAFRRRLDGGYSVAIRNDNLAPLTLDSFRLFFDFLPTALKSMHEYRLGLTPYFFEDWKRARRWENDEITPFELVRTLDPKPVKRDLKNAWANTVKAYPGFGKLKPVQSWAGLIDATPDAVPVISEVPNRPNFYIASGFSGHGFGTGPGAGHLMADIVTGAAPIVDPTPFRLTRFRGQSKG